MQVIPLPDDRASVRREVQLLDDAVRRHLPAGAELEICFHDKVGRLAQLQGTSFYGRIREKFGHLAV